MTATVYRDEFGQLRPPTLTEAIREDVGRLHARWREHASPDCRICHGSGQSRGYIGPSKTATYPCPCTGQPEVT